MSFEKEKSELLQSQLNEQLRNIKMLSKGTKDLDKLLTVGKPGEANWGLGYQGFSFGVKTPFVKATKLKEVQYKISEPHKKKHKGRLAGCYYCGKPGHIKAHCYRLHEKVQQLLKHNRGYPDKRKSIKSGCVNKICTSKLHTLLIH